MAISILDMFSIGIGPSSSHTVGPMRAGLRFLESLQSAIEVTIVDSVKVELFGSLGYTGKGHGSDTAVILGLLGEQPEEVNPETVVDKLQAIEQSGQLLLGKTHIINFKAASDIIFHRRKSLPKHPNGMQFSAYDSDGDLLFSKIYYSVGGGFIVNDDVDDESPVISDTRCLPYPFSTGDELLQQCKDNGLSISALMLANESA